jgi:hypothetical protein
MELPFRIISTYRKILFLYDFFCNNERLTPMLKNSKNVRAVMLCIVFHLLLMMGVSSHAEDTQIKMFRCANILSIFEKYGPERHEDLFRSQKMFFSLTALTLGTQKSYTPQDLNAMNASILRGIERSYKKTPKIILTEAATCSQWIDNIKEAGNAGRFNWAESIPKIPSEKYVNFYERFFDVTFVSWIGDR